MSSFRSSSRYSSFNNRSSTQSDPSSSTELNKLNLNQTKNRRQSPDVSYALARSKSTKNDHNLTSMVKKFMEKRSSSSTKAKGREFVVPADVTTFIADDLKQKTTMSARRGTPTGFGGLHKKLFGNKGKGDESEGKKKTLTEVKPNARTLAMVLRSERELLSQNKDQETEIIELKLTIEEKNREVDKLKDLCLKQREEIKSLKSAILFPDVMNTQLQGLLNQQDSELKQAKQIIPTLQKQVTSLTGQLQSLAEDLAEVKADKYSVTGFYDSLVSSPRTPTHEQEEATNSLEFSSGSQDDMFLNDLNPCLTPYSKSKSKEFETIENHGRRFHEIGFGCHDGKLSKSSNQEYVKSGNSGKIIGCKSDEYKYSYGKW